MLDLKEYQTRALHWLKRYFQECRRLGANTAFYETTSQIYEGDGIGYRKVKEFPGLPYVCLRIPTGGGKTLVACHAVAIANKHLLQADYSLVIWLVPSEAIREQTITALRNRQHPYRQALDAGLGSVAILDISEALYVTKPVLDGNTVIVVATMQAFRREKKEGLKVYESNGHLMSNFAGVPEETLRDVERGPEGTFDYSLCNVFRVRKPVVIVDEAHNARTGLSFETLARLGPSCILELTATPNIKGTEENPPSNVLYSVSAAELKAENMIKLPIRLKNRQNWQELLGEAIGIRNGLEKAAGRERQQTGEYIRPIMLLQAQPKSKERQTITVETLEKALLDDWRIPKEQIARATGEDREIEGIDLAKPDCPIRYIITVQALKEGWDCPFAYVLCSIAELKSSTAVEQILGRVLRLPKASRKTEADLNAAYAFTASSTFAEAANALKDGLVENGFERQEARDLIAPLAEADFDNLELFQAGRRTVAEDVSAKPEKEIPAELAAKVEYDVQAGKIKILAVLTSEEEKQLKECFAKAAIQTEIAEACQRVRVHVESGKKPSERHERFAVPYLAVKQGNFYEQFEANHITDMGWTLHDCDPGLSDEEFSTSSQNPQTAILDMTEKGKVEMRFIEDLEAQMMLLSFGAGWPLARLMVWLDRSFAHTDLTPDETGVFILGAIEHLTQNRGFSLEQLTTNRYGLSNAIERKIRDYRQQAQRNGFQQFLREDFVTPLMVSAKYSFEFPPDAYPYNRRYNGGHVWQRHYYPAVGELGETGEEFDCAVFLDSLPEIKWWARNLAGIGREQTSFWLQTATDKFYPDFVCQLMDGRSFVVEYKNATDWSNDDSREKRALGELWAERSGGKCLFIMPKGHSEITSIATLIREHKSK